MRMMNCPLIVCSAFSKWPRCKSFGRRLAGAWSDAPVICSYTRLYWHSWSTVDGSHFWPLERDVNFLIRTFFAKTFFNVNFLYRFTKKKQFIDKAERKRKMTNCTVFYRKSKPIGWVHIEFCNVQFHHFHVISKSFILFKKNSRLSLW